MAINYLDFELEIGVGNGVDFPVSVVRSPAGEASSAMRWPFSQLALENRLKDVQIALLNSGGKRRQAISSEQQAVQTFGSEIFDALMTGEVRSRYDVSQERARQQGKGLRLKLHIQAPALATLPWEFLYDTRAAEYLCLSRNTPIVRYLELPQTIQPLTITPPLQILGMIATPHDLQPLDIAVEKARVEQAIGDLQARGVVTLTWLEGQTWRHLQRTIGRGGPWHVFHFIGHGGFDTNRDEGMVALADDQGNAKFFSATELGRLLADHHSLRLVLLNACEGARGSVKDVFSSTAATLVRRGIPAVVAMQYAITDTAAIEFAQTFYENLADAIPVDAAVIEARKAISFAITNSVEWGTPVLYMRAPDGQLFDVAKAGSEPLPLSKAVNPAETKPIASKLVSYLPLVAAEQPIVTPQPIPQQPEPESQGSVSSTDGVLLKQTEVKPAPASHLAQDESANEKTMPPTVPAHKPQTWRRWLIGTIVLIVVGFVIALVSPSLLLVPRPTLALQQTATAISQVTQIAQATQGEVIQQSAQAATATAVWLNEDDDRDLLINSQELAQNTKPNQRDTDEDGLDDGAEVNKWGTNPLVADTDGDGLKDGDEVGRGLDPNNVDTDQDGVNDAADPDPGHAPTPTPTDTPLPTHTPSTAAPRTAPPTAVPPIVPTQTVADFSGTWYTNFAEVRLQQSGNQVTGNYQWYGNNKLWNIQGTVTSDTLSGHYMNDTTTQFAFTINAAFSEFDGYWYNRSTGNQQHWCGVKSGPLPDGCGFSGFWYARSNQLPYQRQPTVKVEQVGAMITGVFDNGNPNGTGTVNGQIGTLGTDPQYSFVGTFQMDADGYSNRVRWTLRNNNDRQFVGCSISNDGVADWLGWRDGESEPATDNPVTCP